MRYVLYFVIALLILIITSLILRRLRFKSVGKGLQQNISIPYSSHIELYHNAISLCSIKVRICLSELGIDYKSHHIDLIETGRYENLTSSFAKINPEGTVPVLVVDGHPIYDSAQQIMFLNKLAPSQQSSAHSLIETEEQDRQIEAWVEASSLTDDPIDKLSDSAANAAAGLSIPLFASMLQFVPWVKFLRGYWWHFDPKRPIFFSLLKIFGPARFNKIKPAYQLYLESKRAMSQHLITLVNSLASSESSWITGEYFTVADVSWIAVLERLNQLAIIDELLPIASYPFVHAYWQRCQQRPCYLEAINSYRHPNLVKASAVLEKTHL